MAKHRKNGKGTSLRFRVSMIEEIERMTSEGARIVDVARNLNVDPSTIYRWARKYEGVSCALRMGRIIQCEKVIESLFRRASGYEYEEIRQVGESTIDKSGIETRKLTRVIKTSKHIPADVGCAMYLLKIYWPERFRTNDDNEMTSVVYDILAIKDDISPETEQANENAGRVSETNLD